MSDPQPVRPELGPEHRQRVIDATGGLLSFFSALGREKKTKIYRKVCDVTVYEFPDTKFNGVRATVFVEGQPFEKVCQALLRCTGDVDEGSPRQLRKSMVFQKLYFWTEEDEAAYRGLLDSAVLRDFVFYSHCCGRSPAPAVVKHRDFVVTGRMFSEDGRAALVRASVDYDGNVSKKAVRGRIICNCFIITRLEDRKCRLDNYVLVDPCGAVPSGIFNMAIDQSCDCAVLIKGIAEGTEALDQ